jgi:hypothetical protein
MTVFEQVAALIKQLSPSPVCDDCIADRLQLSVRQHANHKTLGLAGTPGFRRDQGQCSLCETHKKVISYRLR